MVGVEQWAEIRRMHFVEQRSQREIHRLTGLHRDTIRRAIHSDEPPRYRRTPAPSLLDPFKDWIAGQLQADPTIPSQRLREMAHEVGYAGGKTVFDDYVREVRPRYLARRTFQRTIYRPGELMQFDLIEPRQPIPVGYGQTRRGWVLTGELCFSRVIAGALVFSKTAPDLLWGMSHCLERIGALPEQLVWDREGAIHAGGGRPTDEFAGFCGRLGVGWVILARADPQAKGVLERSHRFMRTNFFPGRTFANHLDLQAQLDAWCDRVNARTHRTTRAVPAERLSQERHVMRRLPTPWPELERRFVWRVTPQPYLRVDRNDYSVDPRLAGRRIDVHVYQHEVIAIALDTGELACRHPRVMAGGLTITDPAHQRELIRQRGQRRGRHEIDVEIRPLARYDRLIPT